MINCYFDNINKLPIVKSLQIIAGLSFLFGALSLVFSMIYFTRRESIFLVLPTHIASFINIMYTPILLLALAK